MNGNGTGMELVPVLDMGNGNGTSSTFEKKNGTERSSKNFGTGPITDPVGEVLTGHNF